MDKILAKIAKLVITEKARGTVIRIMEQTMIEQTRDIMITLQDNGYEDAADFIRANYKI